MRKEIYRMDPGEARRMLAAAPVVHVASASPSGVPMLKTVHGVVVDDAVAFHGAPAGEKLEMLGRPAVVGAEEIIAEIPSYFVDPERACPATTYFRSVQVHGIVEVVDDAQTKARVLAALMHKYQPEGGHVPIEAEHPLYRKAIEGLLIARVRLDHVDGKTKLGQNRTPQELTRILEQLWQRGRPTDPLAIERIRAESPSAPTPAFLAGPEGTRLRCALGEDDVEAAVRLLDGQYWVEGVPAAAIATAQRRASAWVGAHDASGRLIATARAQGDGVLRAGVYDVCVAPAWRGRGIGKAVVRLLLDHPAVRGARAVRLATRDAQTLYEQFGFVDVRSAPSAQAVTEMVLRRTEGETLRSVRL